MMKGKGHVAIATHNIRDGRNGGLLSVARAFDHANVDVAVVQEVKLKNPKFAPRTGFGYQIHTTAAGTGNCGGISLLVRENGPFSVEEVKVWGENVLSFQLQVGEEEEDRWHCVGAYFPPSDKEGKAQRLMTAAVKAQPKGARLMVLGDLNADLDSPMGQTGGRFGSGGGRAGSRLCEQTLFEQENETRARVVDFSEAEVHAGGGATMGAGEAGLRARDGAGPAAGAELQMVARQAP